MLSKRVVVVARWRKKSKLAPSYQVVSFCPNSHLNNAFSFLNRYGLVLPKQKKAQVVIRKSVFQDEDELDEEEEEVSLKLL